MTNDDIEVIYYFYKLFKEEENQNKIKIKFYHLFINLLITKTSKKIIYSEENLINELK